METIRPSMGPKHVEVHYTNNTTVLKASTKDGSASTITLFNCSS